MNLTDIRPKMTERMLLVGATGTGKTTLARKLIQSIIADNKKHPVIIIDPKCTYDPEDDRFKLIHSPSALKWSGRNQFIHYRPNPENQDVKSYDAVYQWVFSRKEILVYTDETYMTMRGQRSPQWQTACVTCGRELGIGMLFATQRPSGIDLRIYTESEHKVCFYLAYDKDRDRMAEEMGKVVLTDPVLAAQSLDINGSPHPHAFWRWNSGERVTRLAELNLGGNKGGV